MITGELKSQVDRIWEAFWTGGISNPLTVIEQFTFGEFDQNGFPDFFTGGNKEEASSNVIHANIGASIDVAETILSNAQVKSSLIVDFDSDGKTDLWLTAERNDSTLLYWYSDIAEFSDSLVVYRDSLFRTNFADFNLDGNIDYAELRQGQDSLEVVFFLNRLFEKNFGPFKPSPQVAVQTGGGEMTVSWQSGLDSLTNSESVSYDALLMNMDTVALFEANMSTGNFWPIGPAHGNQLYGDELVLNKLPAGDYFYLVKGIDNAFNTSCCKDLLSVCRGYLCCVAWFSY